MSQIPFTIQEFDEIVHGSKYGNPTQINQSVTKLYEIQNNPQAFEWVPTILQHAKRIDSKIIALTILKKKISNHWDKMTEDQRQSIKDFIFNQINHVVNQLALHPHDGQEDTYLIQLNDIYINMIEKEWIRSKWMNVITQIWEHTTRSSSFSILQNAMQLYLNLCEQIISNKQEHTIHILFNQFKEHLYGYLIQCKKNHAPSQSTEHLHHILLKIVRSVLKDLDESFVVNQLLPFISSYAEFPPMMEVRCNCYLEMLQRKQCMHPLFHQGFLQEAQHVNQQSVPNSAVEFVIGYFQRQLNAHQDDFNHLIYRQLSTYVVQELSKKNNISLFTGLLEAVLLYLRVTTNQMLLEGLLQPSLNILMTQLPVEAPFRVSEHGIVEPYEHRSLHSSLDAIEVHKNYQIRWTHPAARLLQSAKPLIHVEHMILSLWNQKAPNFENSEHLKEICHLIGLSKLGFTLSIVSIDWVYHVIDQSLTLLDRIHVIKEKIIFELNIQHAILSVTHWEKKLFDRLLDHYANLLHQLHQTNQNTFLNETLKTLLHLVHTRPSPLPLSFIQSTLSLYTKMNSKDRQAALARLFTHAVIPQVESFCSKELLPVFYSLPDVPPLDCVKHLIHVLKHFHAFPQPLAEVIIEKLLTPINALQNLTIDDPETFNYVEDLSFHYYRLLNSTLSLQSSTLVVKAHRQVIDRFMHLPEDLISLPLLQLCYPLSQRFQMHPDFLQKMVQCFVIDQQGFVIDDEELSFFMYQHILPDIMKSVFNLSLPQDVSPLSVATWCLQSPMTPSFVFQKIHFWNAFPPLEILRLVLDLPHSLSTYHPIVYYHGFLLLHLLNSQVELSSFAHQVPSVDFSFLSSFSSFNNLLSSLSGYIDRLVFHQHATSRSQLYLDLFFIHYQLS